MVLMIDNYDSFTYNIVQYCRELGADLKIVRNDEVDVDDIKKMQPEKIIISPGPATPKEAGISLSVIKEFGGVIPILGICLGHQAIAMAYGCDIVKAKNLMHGKTSVIHIDKRSILFKDIPDEFIATRYHSLVVQKPNLNDITITAHSTDDNEIMALEINNKKIYGVQFHPESIMSEYGYKIIDNFLKL
jgi:anthranilate synthase component 2